MVTLQKEVIGKDVTKETIVQIQKDVKRGKRYASLRLPDDMVDFRIFRSIAYNDRVPLHIQLLIMLIFLKLFN